MSDVPSQLVSAFVKLNEKIKTDVSGQYGHTVRIKTNGVEISNENLDCEFNIPFDDDTEANEATITVYNLSDSTLSKIVKKKKITVEAGYGDDTGIIFSGFITKKKTKYSNCDKSTTITALDCKKLKEHNIKQKSFGKNTKASTILKWLVKQVDLPLACFKIKRDHTYKDSQNVSGGLMDNIKKFAKICGVSAYILKSKIYVRPLNTGENTYFELSYDTGLTDLEDFSVSEKNEKFKDKYHGYKMKMLLQHRIQTASIINLNTPHAKGNFRVRSGTHSYDGTNMMTEVEAIEY